MDDFDVDDDYDNDWSYEFEKKGLFYEMFLFIKSRNKQIQFSHSIKQNETLFVGMYKSFFLFLGRKLRKEKVNNPTAYLK